MEPLPRRVSREALPWSVLREALSGVVTRGAPPWSVAREALCGVIRREALPGVVARVAPAQLIRRCLYRLTMVTLFHLTYPATVVNRRSSGKYSIHIHINISSKHSINRRRAVALLRPPNSPVHLLMALHTQRIPRHQSPPRGALCCLMGRCSGRLRFRIPRRAMADVKGQAQHAGRAMHLVHPVLQACEFPNTAILCELMIFVLVVFQR